jgi:hypothetical protein
MIKHISDKSSRLARIWNGLAYTPRSGTTEERVLTFALTLAIIEAIALWFFWK